MARGGFGMGFFWDPWDLGFFYPEKSRIQNPEKSQIPGIGIFFRAKSQKSRRNFGEIIDLLFCDWLDLTYAAMWHRRSISRYVNTQRWAPKYYVALGAVQIWTIVVF